jgi:hypothetical protein
MNFQGIDVLMLIDKFFNMMEFVNLPSMEASESFVRKNGRRFYKLTFLKD